MSPAERFRALHRDGIFVMPNAWDAGSARLLEHLGFPALATTSSGHAGSLGRLDQQVRRDELLAHVEALASVTSVPLSVDAEACFPDEPGGVARTVDLIAAAGAAGCSIEDYDPQTGVLPFDLAVERVHEVAEAAAPHRLVVTARAENHLYGSGDLGNTVARLAAYRDAGADVLYAPGLVSSAEIRRLVDEIGAPLNVLALPGVPPVPDLARLGVRRVSTGGSLAWVAYGALATAARELLTAGTSNYLETALPPDLRDAAFSQPG